MQEYNRGGLASSIPEHRTAPSRPCQIQPPRPSVVITQQLDSDSSRGYVDGRASLSLRGCRSVEAAGPWRRILPIYEPGQALIIFGPAYESLAVLGQPPPLLRSLVCIQPLEAIRLPTHVDAVDIDLSGRRSLHEPVEETSYGHGYSNMKHPLPSRSGKRGPQWPVLQFSLLAGKESVATTNVSTEFVCYLVPKPKPSLGNCAISRSSLVLVHTSARGMLP